MPGAPKGVLVTGGARRIGAAIVKALARDGRPVAIHYKASQQDAEALAAEISARGGRAAAVQADLADPAQAASLLAHARDAIGAVTAVVNNASLFGYDDAATATAGSFDRHMAVNARAPLLLAQSLARALADLPAGETGVIVNILDQKLANPNPDFLSYTASKYALEGLTNMLAIALAPSIRVVGVAPGLTLPSGGQSGGKFAGVHTQTLLGRGTTPQDIANTVRYVLAAPSITGQTITVDAGQHLQPSRRDVMFVPTGGPPDGAE